MAEHLETQSPCGAPPPEYLSVAELAAYTGLSAKFWNTLRSSGGGPLYVRVSAKAIRYRRADVDEWMQERVRRSTFDDRQVAA